MIGRSKRRFPGKCRRVPNAWCIVAAVAVAAAVLSLCVLQTASAAGARRLPVVALRPSSHDAARELRLNLLQDWAGPDNDLTVMWGLAPREVGKRGPAPNVYVTIEAGTTLADADWDLRVALWRISSRPLVASSSLPSGRRLADGVWVPRLRATTDSIIGVARGPACARFVVSAPGRPDGSAARLAEQLAERFCWRVDRALEYILAKTFTLKAGGEKLECRQVPSGALVGDLGALCDAIDAGIRVEQDGEVVLLRLGKKEVRLQVGYETAQVGKAGAKLHFPTLKWSEDGYIADLSGIAILLGAKVKY